MGEKSAIGWTDATFNPWWGCDEVSPACDLCYARVWDRRVGGAHWGPKAPRRQFGDKHWDEPRRWNERSAREGRRTKVFCLSMGDWADNKVPSAWRIRLFALIRETPHLDWLLLTKRIGNVPAMLPPDWGDGYPNVWLGISVCNQHEADRDIPKLLRIDARGRFLSIEPMLEHVNLRRLIVGREGKWTFGYDALTGRQSKWWPDPFDPSNDEGELHVAPLKEAGPRINWVICGGESGGAEARIYDLAWPRDLRDQCRQGGTAFFHKQLGCKPVSTTDPITHRGYPGPKFPGFSRYLNDKSGTDPAEWPADLRVQEFPMGLDHG